MRIVCENRLIVVVAEVFWRGFLRPLGKKCTQDQQVYLAAACCLPRVDLLRVNGFFFAMKLLNKTSPEPARYVFKIGRIISPLTGPWQAVAMAPLQNTEPKTSF